MTADRNGDLLGYTWPDAHVKGATLTVTGTASWSGEYVTVRRSPGDVPTTRAAAQVRRHKAAAAEHYDGATVYGRCEDCETNWTDDAPLSRCPACGSHEVRHSDEPPGAGRDPFGRPDPKDDPGAWSE